MEEKVEKDYLGITLEKDAKKRLAFMSDFLFDQKMIPNKTLTDASKWSFSLAFTIVSTIITEQSKGRNIDEIKIPISSLVIKKNDFKIEQIAKEMENY